MGIKNLILHVHSDQSIKDGAQTPTEIVKRAKELGAPAVTLTDHGVLTGTFEFLKACKAEGIKGIPGVEAYVVEPGNDIRRHLILLAKDAQGYKAIEKAVTESNKHIVQLRTKAVPCMNKEIIQQWFGEGSLGHDHVIATSACVQGVVATELLSNHFLDSIIKKAERQRSKFPSPGDIKMLEKEKKIKELESQEKLLRNEKNEFSKLAKAPLKAAQKYYEKMKGTLIENEAKESLDNLIASKDSAAEKVEVYKTKIAAIKKEISALRTETNKFREGTKKWEKYNDEILAAESKKIAESILLENAAKEALYYQKIFGKNNFFIELQYHGGPNEDYVFPRLLMISKRLGIKCVPANDAHYTKKEDFRRREIIVCDSFKKVFDKVDPCNKELYIKSDEELADMLLNIIPKKDVDDAFENLKLIADACNVELPREKHYPVYKNLPEGETAETYIRKLAYKGIEKRYPDGAAPDGTKWDQAHIDRLENELTIIHDMGFDNYHLVVQDYLNYGRNLGFDCPEGVGYTIGPGRGSAVGSLVCYLLGITDLDPIKYNLFFERYLNPERVSMPDIDADFANCIRDKVIDYERRLYGEEGVCGVTTKGTLKIKAAILLAGRVNPETYSDVGRVRKISKAVPKGAQSFKDYVDPSDKSQGTVLDKMLADYAHYPVETQIIKDAASIEGLTVSFGRHAAAVILSDTGDVSDQVALMFTNGNWAVQCVKEEAEAEVGTLKMDFLGLINLDIMTESLRKIYHNYGLKIDMSKDVHFEDEVFKNIFSTGNTDAVFQFSSQGMKQMLKDFKPSSFEDLILLVAAYRPGPMQYLADIIAVKHGRKKAKYTIPELKPILEGTYGKTVYQEQVQEIFKRLAGYSLGQADLVRRAMSKKKMKELEKEREAFLHGDASRDIKGCVANGINESAANQLFDEMMDFASYAFNKSHAAAYAYVAYQTAWFKYHYPTEYMASVMEMAKYEKVPMYVFDAKNMGLNIHLPDINKSDVGFKALSNNTILYGFNAIKGIGNLDIDAVINERKKGEFVSFKSFIKRTNISKSSFEALVYSGAFDCFNTNRKALYDYGMKLRDLKKKYNDTKEKLIKAKEEITPESPKRLLTKIDNMTKSLELQGEEMNNLIMTNGYEDKISKLTKEKDILGSFISDHPVNNYKMNKNSTSIKAVKSGYDIVLSGLITDFVKYKTKNGGEEFCSFNLDDGTGIIKTTVFPKDFRKFGENLFENQVVSLKGTVRSEKVETENSTPSDENTIVDYVYKFFATSLEENPKKKQYSVIMNLKTAADWIFIYESVKEKYLSNDGEGLNLFIYDETFCELRRTGLVVKSSILQDSSFALQKSNIVE